MPWLEWVVCGLVKQGKDLKLPEQEKGQRVLTLRMPVGPPQELLRRARELQSLRLSAKEHTIILSSLTSRALWRHGLGIIELMAQRQVQSDAAARHAALSGSWSHAHALWRIEAALGAARDLDDAAAVAARGARDWSTAGDLLASLAHRSVRASLRSRTAAGGAMSSCYAWRNALELHGEADAQLTTTVAGACTRAMQWQIALQLLKPRAGQWDQRLQGCLVDALAKGRHLEHICGIRKPNLVTLTSVIGACGGAMFRRTSVGCFMLEPYWHIALRSRLLGVGDEPSKKGRLRRQEPWLSRGLCQAHDVMSCS